MWAITLDVLKALGGKMGFLQYLMLGGVAYGAGVGIRHYVFADKIKDKGKIYQFTGAFFVVMLGIAWFINSLILQKSTPDIAFIIVTALVASFIFYQGLNPDDNQQVPD